MRAKIDKIVNLIKDKENQKKIAPVVSVVGFALLVASAVLFILSIVGLFLPGIDGGNFFSVFKIAGLGVFALLVGRKWSTLEVKSKENLVSEEEEIKLLEGPAEERLDLHEKEDSLELKKDKTLEVELPEASENADFVS